MGRAPTSSSASKVSDYFTPKIVLEFGNAVTAHCPMQWIAKKGKNSLYNAFLQCLPQVGLSMCEVEVSGSK
jgi:hypothetical protein